MVQLSLEWIGIGINVDCSQVGAKLAKMKCRHASRQAIGMVTYCHFEANELLSPSAKTSHGARSSTR